MNDEPLDWTQGVPTVLTSSCVRCGHRWYVRRQRCPRCTDGRQARDTASPTGAVVAMTSMSPDLAPDGVGTSIALVDLDDGSRILARCSPNLVPGTAVRWYFPDVDAGSKAGRPRLLVPHVRMVE